MINFRYHLVSLISVFLALAVGIVLGAGPLRDTISDQLTGQVEQLRQEKDDLRVQLDTAQREVSDLEGFTSATADQLIADTLPEHRVALVRTPGVEELVVEELLADLEVAGAEMVADVTLGELWADPGQGAFRARAADEVATLLGETPPADDDPAVDVAVLARGLAEGLRGASEEDPRVSGTVATDLMTALGAGSEPLVTGEVTQPADLVLIVTAPGQEPAADATPDPEAEALREAWGSVLTTIGGATPSVVAGYVEYPTDVLPLVRQTGGVTTTDRLGEEVGRLVAVLALGATAADIEPAAYGFGPGATAVVPPATTLEPPLVLQPTPTPDPTGDGSGEPDDGSTPAEGENGEPTGEAAADAAADAGWLGAAA
ncbi:copper transporter [Salana multivorans]